MSATIYFAHNKFRSWQINDISVAVWRVKEGERVQSITAMIERQFDDDEKVFFPLRIYPAALDFNQLSSQSTSISCPEKNMFFSSIPRNPGNDSNYLIESLSERRNISSHSTFRCFIARRENLAFALVPTQPNPGPCIHFHLLVFLDLHRFLTFLYPKQQQQPWEIYSIFFLPSFASSGIISMLIPVKSAWRIKGNAYCLRCLPDENIYSTWWIGIEVN